VDGYERLRPLSHEEHAALPVLAAVVYPPHPKNYRYWRDRRGEDIGRRFHRDVATLRTLRAEMERIGPALIG
jgi:hypothetical protein